MKRVGAAVIGQAGEAAVAVKDAVGTVVEKVQERVSEMR